MSVDKDCVFCGNEWLDTDAEGWERMDIGMMCPNCVVELDYEPEEEHIALIVNLDPETADVTLTTIDRVHNKNCIFSGIDPNEENLSKILFVECIDCGWRSTPDNLLLVDPGITACPFCLSRDLNYEEERV